MFAENFEAGNLSQWSLSGAQGTRGNDWTNRTSYYGYSSYVPSFSGGAQSTARFATYNNGSTYYYGNSCNRWMTSNTFSLVTGTNYTLTFWTRGGCESYYDNFMIGINRGDGSFYYTMPSTYSGSYYNNYTYAYSGYSASGRAPFGPTGWIQRSFNFTALGTTGQLRIGFESDSSVESYAGPAIDEIMIQ